ncbi:cell envelope integrity protein TolA, partial [Marichromatium gracile]
AAARAEAERRAAEEAARREAERRAAEEAARREAERQAAAARQERIEREAEQMAELERQRFEDEIAREAERLEAEAAETETARRSPPVVAGGGGGGLSSAEQRQVDYYKGVIGDRVRQHFAYPPGMSEGLSVEFEVRVTSAGYIVPGSVAMQRSSGTPAFDQAALAALWRAEPLPVPSGALFDQFREFTFTFRP